MEDQRVGAAFRAVRLRRRWRQDDVADPAGVSRALVSLIERGHLDRTPIGLLRRVATVLDIRIDLVARWRGGELDRLVNAGHSAMHEALARFFLDLPTWVTAPEVSFSIYGERGVIDILAWHPGRRALLVIELKTDLVDVQALIGALDRYRRLAPIRAREMGWSPLTVSSWVILADTRTNRRRVAAHLAVLRNAFPGDGRSIRPWLRDPVGTVSALSFWSSSTPGSARATSTPRQRVSAPRDRAGAAEPSVAGARTALSRTFGTPASRRQMS